MLINDPQVTVVIAVAAVLLWVSVLVYIMSAAWRNASRTAKSMVRTEQPPTPDKTAHEWDEYGTYTPPPSSTRFEDWN